jgi:hypothetical protein
MVERIMLFKLVDGSTRAQVAALTKSALTALPALLELSVGLPSDAASEKSWDVSVVMRFSHQSALESALASEPFRGYLEQAMAGRYAVVKAWSFAQQ